MLSKRFEYSPEPAVRLLPAQVAARNRVLRDLHFGEYHFTQCTLSRLVASCGLEIVHSDDSINLLARLPKSKENIPIELEEPCRVLKILNKLENEWEQKEIRRRWRKRARLLIDAIRNL
jgi:hypothetical protein